MILVSGWIIHNSNFIKLKNRVLPFFFSEISFLFISNKLSNIKKKVKNIIIDILFSLYIIILSILFIDYFFYTFITIKYFKRRKRNASEINFLMGCYYSIYLDTNRIITYFIDYFTMEKLLYSINYINFFDILENQSGVS